MLPQRAMEHHWTPRPGGVDEEQLAVGGGALADPLAQRSGEQRDALARDVGRC
jgi:hypothetical protein